MMIARRLALASLVSLAASCAAPPPSDGPVDRSTSRIVYGTPDTTHTAVVAVLSADNSGVYTCTGTVVQVTSGVAYILTAAHCCTAPEPSMVVIGSDYAVGLNYLMNSSTSPLQPPMFAVIPGSVKADSGYNPNASAPVHDFCMLQAILPAGTPVIPVATGSDGLAVGVTVEYVGFGVTGSSTAGQNNTLNEHASAPVDQSVTSTYFQYTEGGNSHIGGPCEGDSGGPALLPAGAAQSAQKVVGTTSYGDPNCTQYGVSMRVTSATGSGGFISNYLNSIPLGLDGGTHIDAAPAQADAAAHVDAGVQADAAAPHDSSATAADTGIGLPDATPTHDAAESQTDGPWVPTLIDGSATTGDSGHPSSGTDAATGPGAGGTAGGCALAGARQGGVGPWLALGLALAALGLRRRRAARPGRNS
jgi:hypothetical protein